MHELVVSKRYGARTGALLAVLLMVACAKTERIQLDASADGDRGAGEGGAIAGRSAGLDAGVPEGEADASSPPPRMNAEDARVNEGGLDASLADAAPDAGRDAAPDAGPDAGPLPFLPCDDASVRLCTLEFPGTTDRLGPSALSADGSTVIGTAWASGLEDTDDGPDYDGWTWTRADRLTRLPHVAVGFISLESFPLAVSEDGAVVLWRGGDRYELWSPGLSRVSVPLARATDLSDDATVVVGAVDSDGVTWTQAGGIARLGHLEPPACGEPCPIATVAMAVSGDGRVVVGSSGRKAFRWSQSEGLQDITPAARETAAATAISGDGTVIVGCDFGTPRSPCGSLWRFASGQGATELGELPGEGGTSREVSLNADGSVIVGESNGRAFVWDAEHGIRELGTVLTEAGIDTTDWQFTSARGISADGKVITGTASYMDRRVGFITWLP